MMFSLFKAAGTVCILWLVSGLLRLVYNVFLHPLRKFPGPTAAKATTWWKTYIEVVKQESMTDVLFKLHKQYGPYQISSRTLSTLIIIQATSFELDLMK
jgi:hypothetical protein